MVKRDLVGNVRKKCCMTLKNPCFGLFLPHRADFQHKLWSRKCQILHILHRFVSRFDHRSSKLILKRFWKIPDKNVIVSAVWLPDPKITVTVHTPYTLRPVWTFLALMTLHSFLILTYDLQYIVIIFGSRFCMFS